MAGHCQLKLEKYPAAIELFQHGLNAHPDDAFDIAGLITAYSLTGKTIEANEQREHLRSLAVANRLPKNLSFVIDKFKDGEQSVEVTEIFPYTVDKFHYRYIFLISQQGQAPYRIALESDDYDQIMAQELNPQKTGTPAAGQRRYSLDRYGTNTHATYKFYDGEPSYETVRSDVKQALAGTLRPKTSQTYAAPKSPADNAAPAPSTAPASK